MTAVSRICFRRCIETAGARVESSCRKESEALMQQLGQLWLQAVSPMRVAQAAASKLSSSGFTRSGHVALVRR